MPQFTAYQNKNAHTKKRFPLLLDIQSGLLDELRTRVVVPLAAAGKSDLKPMSRLMPLLEVEGASYVMLTPQLAGINKKELGKPVVDLSGERAEIMAALDFLMTGF